MRIDLMWSSLPYLSLPEVIAQSYSPYLGPQALKKGSEFKLIGVQVKVMLTLCHYASLGVPMACQLGPVCSCAFPQTSLCQGFGVLWFFTFRKISALYRKRQETLPHLKSKQEA